MITIPIVELKKFLNNAKSIRDNKSSSDRLPILLYVKLECKGDLATLTKTNLQSFVITEIDAEFKKDEIILIEEQTLSGCVNYSRGKEIKISVVKDNVILNDGFREVKCQTIENHFPAIETNNSHEKIQFYTDIITSLSLAKSHTLPATDKAVREWKCFVHIKKINEKSYIVGVNGAISFLKSFKEDLPEISIDPETVGIISKYDMVEYSSNDRYDYFQNGGTTYGFIKAETKCPALETVVDKFKSENCFTANRKELIDFCDMVMNLTGSSVPPEVSISDDGNTRLALNFSDISGNQSANESIYVEGKTFQVPKIYLYPKDLLTAFKDLPVDKIKISKIFGNMIISSPEDKDYLGSIMELAKI